jgi:hypothetical protein
MGDKSCLVATTPATAEELLRKFRRIICIEFIARHLYGILSTEFTRLGLDRDQVGSALKGCAKNYWVDERPSAKCPQCPFLGRITPSKESAMASIPLASGAVGVKCNFIDSPECRV